LRRFENLDTDKETKEHSGFLTFEEVKQVFEGSNWLTPKEQNILLRDYAIKYDKQKVDYRNFAEDLYDCRFELAKSRLMDTNIERIEDNVLEACRSRDPKKSGKIRIQTL